MSDLSHVPVCLTIAGSDSSGGAGIQADLRTFSYFDVYGTTVITAVTAQTPGRVIEVFPVSQEMIASQLNAALETANIQCIKIGMVGSEDTLRTLGDILRSFDGPIIMDPVLSAGCGGQLNKTLTKSAILEFASSCATILTPNLPEAEYLLDRPLISRNDYDSAVIDLQRQCDADIYLKGGHAADQDDRSCDLFVLGDMCYELTAPALDPMASHGTGCTLSSALAANLANGSDPIDSAVAAKAFVWQSLNNCVALNDSFFGMVPPAVLKTSMITLARL